MGCYGHTECKNQILVKAKRSKAKMKGIAHCQARGHGMAQTQDGAYSHYKHIAHLKVRNIVRLLYQTK